MINATDHQIKMSSSTRTKNRNYNGIALLLLGLLVAQCLLSMRFNSPTSDEQNHISRGYHYLVTGKLDLNVAPPFVNLLSGIPLLLHKGIIVPQYDMTHRKTYINEFAEQFVWVYNDAETIINSGRLAIVFLSVVLGYFVFRWGKELWGPAAGLLALFLYVLDPNILAHSQLATTDLGLACLVFVTTYFLWRFLRWRHNRDLGLAGVLAGLSLATKLNALLILPVMGLIVVIEGLLLRDLTLKGPWPGKAWGSRRPLGSRLYFVAAVLFVVALLDFASLWASYRFETELLADSPIHATVDRFVPPGMLRQIAYELVERVPIPFPTYFSGVRWLQRYAQRGAPAFLMGQQSTKGWWYYFLVAFAIKTPLSTLVLAAAMLWAALFRCSHGENLSDHTNMERRDYVLYVPMAAFFLSAVLSPLNIGYRHILPVLPFLFVLLGNAVTWVNRRWVQVALVVLGLWYALASARIYPHYLAYFNEIIGGPDNGYNYLVDSNLDWGQDLKNLKAYLDSHDIHEIHLVYFGSAYPSYYDIQAAPLPTQEPEDLESRTPSVYAISATYLQSGYLGDADAFRWLRQYEPFAKIGYSIFLYRLPYGN
jgi:hypothetical protein